MSQVKNISGGELDVPFLDRVVAADEIVEVPDTQPDGSPIIWPDNRWQPVSAKEAKTAAKADVAASADTTGKAE